MTKTTKTTKTKVAARKSTRPASRVRKTGEAGAPTGTRATPVARAGGKDGVTVKTSRAPRLPKAVATAVAAAQGKKASDVVVLDLRKAAGFTDFFVICTGENTRQINAIADAVRDVLRQEFDERPVLAEGLDTSEWILLDYFDFVVHVFSRDCRAFYGLERLWGNASRLSIDDDAPPT